MKRVLLAVSLLMLCLIGRIHLPSSAAAEESSSWPSGPEISSGAAIIIEESTGLVLYEKNADEAYYPSSAVKIMTALLALENASLTDEVTMTATGVSGVSDGGVSISSQVGEIFTMEQCIYAIILSSANDISLQVAEHIGGSVENFVAMMNQRAAELGCTNTVFTNPTGLSDEAQHTSARDLAVIMSAAMRNPVFAQISSTLTYTIPATNLSGGERTLTNKFTMLDPSSDAYYIGCLGGKEGYTAASGSVLTVQAMRNDMTLTCVVMFGSADQTDDEAITLLDFAYQNFSFVDLGSDDFNVITGGILLLPVGISAEQLQILDTDAGDGTMNRVYSLDGRIVGTASVQIIEVSDDSRTAESEKHFAEAEEYSTNISLIPYLLILLCFASLMVILFRKLKKIRKT